MSITSSETTDLSATRSGYRARYKFTLSDGREVLRGPVNVESEAASDAKRVSMEADVLASVQLSDAQEAVSKGIFTDYKLANDTLVQYTALSIGYEEPELYRAYEKMKDIAPGLLALGYTNEQYATAFNATVEQVVNIKDFWQILDANADTLQAYLDLVESV